MLYEIKNVEQDSGEFRKRWFFNHEIDLLVWLNSRDEIVGFQLCYDKLINPHALTWFRESGYQHNRIDFREDKIGRRRGSPILLANGTFEVEKISEVFLRKSRDMDRLVSAFIYEKINGYLAATDKSRDGR